MKTSRNWRSRLGDAVSAVDDECGLITCRGVKFSSSRKTEWRDSRFFGNVFALNILGVKLLSSRDLDDKREKNFTLALIRVPWAKLKIIIWDYKMKIRRNLESASENISTDITGADANTGAGRAWNCRGVKFFSSNRRILLFDFFNFY